MEKKNWLEIMAGQMQLNQIMDTNNYTGEFGLALSHEDTEVLILERQNVLKSERRVEFGQSILPKIIYTFCDSAYIMQDNYLDSLVRLQEIFYLYKNEMDDEITDDELLNFMKEQFEDVCYGDLDYLERTCLDIFAQAIRSGYRGYYETEGRGQFEQLDIVKRWDKELYMEVLQELFWR